MTKQSYLPEIPALKYLLCIGVVVIHLFLPVERDTLSTGTRVVMDVWYFIRGYIASPCLWAFMAVSGMLYFRGVDRITPGVYMRKLRSRVHTLLVPYLLWNIVGLVIFMVKVNCFGYPGHGIVEEGRIDWLMLLRGFWSVGMEYPYDSSLWFIRDLFIIGLLSPLVYYLARLPWLLVAAAVVLAYLYPGFLNRYAVVYFAFGGWMAMHPRWFRQASPRRVAATGCAVWIALTAILISGVSHIPLVINITEIFANCAFAVTVIAAIRLVPEKRLSRFSALYPSAFFVFALHCFYTGAVKQLYTNLIGLYTPWRLAAVILLSFTTVMTFTTAIYFIARAISPRLTALLSGGRS